MSESTKTTPRRLGLLTGGGDAPGLNAVIRAAVRTAERSYGVESIGILDGFSGLLDRRFRPLAAAETRDLHMLGGTILGTTNRVNPFHAPPIEPADGSERSDNRRVDRSGDVIEAMREQDLDALIVIGGDGTLRIAHELAALGVCVVGVPKTIDNDLEATDVTFGFWTAIGVVTDALDRLRDTAESHHRVMVLEVMGREAGWIALQAGLAGGADVILLPEIPYRAQAVADKIEERRLRGQAFSLVVVAEGAAPIDGEAVYQPVDPKSGRGRLGGAGVRLADELADLVDHEIRVTVLGHLQRGGSPTPYDRVLATRFGEHAVRLAMNGRFGRMVCLQGRSIRDVPLKDAVATVRLVDPQGELVATARSVGTGFGDESI